MSSVNPSWVARGSFPWSLPIFLSPNFSLSKFSFVRRSPRTKMRTDLWVWKRFVGQMKSNFKLFESDGGENAVRWLVKIFWVIAIVISKSEVIYWFKRNLYFGLAVLLYDAIRAQRTKIRRRNCWRKIDFRFSEFQQIRFLNKEIGFVELNQSDFRWTLERSNHVG